MWPLNPSLCHRETAQRGNTCTGCGGCTGHGISIYRGCAGEDCLLDVEGEG
jgi:hypothetical protein